MTEYEKLLQREIANIASILSDGKTRLRAVDNGEAGITVELVTHHRFDHVAFDHMLHHGWLESMANGGTYKLSDAGLLAYLRSTDEMGDGKLVDPSPEFQP